MKNKSIYIGLGVLLVASALIAFPKVQKNQDTSLDGFAQCLADAGATMYGAEWCSHCQREKAAFGGSWRLVPYVECPENTQLCVEKDVQGYPTWIFDDGRRFSGVQGLEKLSEASSCPLPEGK